MNVTAIGSKSRQGAPANPPARNPGLAFDGAFLEEMRFVNRSALERRSESLVRRRSVKGRAQAEWLLRAIACMDLTSLNSSDTQARILRLCAKARNPLRADIAAQLGVAEKPVRPAAVCVYHPFVAAAVEALRGTGIKVAAVSAAFPHGLAPLETRLREIELSLAEGADEIDIVITRGHVLSGNWRAVHDEIKAMRQACGGAVMKAILGTGDLANLRNVTLAALLAMMAGADFVKTSTGKEAVNATLPVGLAMVRAIRAYHERTGIMVGFKPAGGISSAKTALDWLVLMREELGSAWQEADLFRLGASSLLTDIERQLEHFVTGHYSAAHRHAMV